MRRRQSRRGKDPPTPIACAVVTIVMDDLFDTNSVIPTSDTLTVEKKNKND
jgi:hypothetical protein